MPMNGDTYYACRREYDGAGNVARERYYGADGEKIMNIVGKLLPVLDYPLIRVERTEVTALENA